MGFNRRNILKPSKKSAVYHKQTADFLDLCHKPVILKDGIYQLFSPFFTPEHLTAHVTLCLI